MSDREMNEEAAAFDANFLRHTASVCRAAYDLCQPKPQRTSEDVREHYGELCLSELANIADEIEQRLAASNRKAVDGCHCGTCTCNPNMTPAMRFDLSPAQTEGAIREHLIRLGWTPPDEAETLRAEVERLKSMTAVTMGIGSGDGSLFVHGDYDSIKAAQALVFRAERLAEALRALAKRRQEEMSND